jgi:arginyl-tRNA synthetase
MIERKLSQLIREGLERAAVELGVEELPEEIELTRPKQKVFGDFSTNVAMAVGSRFKRNPREVANTIVRLLPPVDFVTKVEVAGPGFINFHVAHGWLYDVLRDVVAQGAAYGRGEPVGESVQVEFVSANPTGPLHVGHARNAVLGDSIANVLAAAGYRVEREYYYNDAGRQMDLFALSVEARYLEQAGRPSTFPEEGYRGAYIGEIAATIHERHGDALTDLDPEQRLSQIRGEAVSLIFEWIEKTLARFGVRFDSWLSERTLHERGAIAEAVDRLRASGHAYDHEGAVWFRATEFGDDKDRVLIRATGAPTYFAADCAYLIDKFGRGFDHLIYVWGADHHGDVKRVKGAAQALGFDPDRVEIFLYQFVSFSRGGQPVPMSKRTGDLITLDELMDEVGTDAARYTLLTRSHDTTIEFDIEEVSRQSLENPVYYVQYAHARIASILRHAESRGIERRPVDEVDLELLALEAELDLLRKLAEFREEVQVAAELRAPYRLTRYVEELAAEFHRFYTESRVVTDDPALTQARLWLSMATKQVIANALALLGVSAPESMERADA